MQQKAAELVRLFGEDPAETEPQAILGTLGIFLRRLEKAADDVRRRREAAARGAREAVGEGAPVTPSNDSDGLLSPGSSARRSSLGRSRPSLSLVSAIDSIAFERPTVASGAQRGHNAR